MTDKNEVIITIILFKHNHSVHLPIFNYISVSHSSRSQSRHYNHQSTHTFLLSHPVFGRLAAGLLLPLTSSPIATNSESSYALSEVPYS
jgi:hypothetical protein